ncbi:MAG: hypothetical protein NVSMB4_09820 [Acidimicrobiales bacterium]
MGDDATSGSGNSQEADEALFGYPSEGESRWPSAAAVLAAVVLQVILPGRLTVGPRWVVPALEVLLVVGLMIANPTRLTRKSRDMRVFSVGLIALISLANAVSLGLLIRLLANGTKANGKELILAAVGIWLTQVIVFGLWYWEVDRGGPMARMLPDHDAPDFLWSQMTNPGVTKRRWVPSLGDYLYLSLTNSTAFSPTDTMPLSVRAKALMASQSLVSLATVAIVGARAVNILS